MGLAGLTVSKRFRDQRPGRAVVHPTASSTSQAGSGIRTARPYALPLWATADASHRDGRSAERIYSTRPVPSRPCRRYYVPTSDLTDRLATTFTTWTPDRSVPFHRRWASAWRQWIAESTLPRAGSEIVGQRALMAMGVSKSPQQYRDLRTSIAILGMDKLSESEADRERARECKFIDDRFSATWNGWPLCTAQAPAFWYRTTVHTQKMNVFLQIAILPRTLRIWLRHLLPQPTISTRGWAGMPRLSAIFDCGETNERRGRGRRSRRRQSIHVLHEA